MQSLSFTIPHLAHRQLSSNGSHGHWSKDSAGRVEMRAFTAQALPVDLPSWESVEVSFTYWTVRARSGAGCCSSGGFKAEKCPTCLQRHFSGTLGASTCQCLRPTDNWNLFPVAKPLVDALVDAGIIPDDKHEQATVGLVRIQHCATIEEERIEVYVRPIEVTVEAVEEES